MYKIPTSKVTEAELKQARASIALKQFQKLVHANANTHGFHDLAESQGQFLTRAVALYHSEVSEMFEAYRRGILFAECDKADKMTALGMERLTNIEEESADLAIRLMDVCERLGVDLERAIVIKHLYNMRREYLHGGKKA